ncbi:MAG: hypothetical protein H0X38_18875, partial [Planctomycetes bacterium]|nr:hypothetical protein [Planctomycetota bacterium]
MRSILTCLLLVCSCCIMAQQTDNHGLRAVPAPGPVVIDGTLADWDLSGAVPMCYDLESLADTYAAQVALMYDADNLYVAIRWKDQQPLGNSHDPRYQTDRGWSGDAVQLRIRTDRIAHVTSWYYAPHQEPFIGIDYGKGMNEAFGGGGKALFRVHGWELAEGAAAAFVVDADGKGYVQELRLPWALITEHKHYAAGDTLACGVELLWGEADWPVHRYADNLAPGRTQREFFFTDPTAWGPVTLERSGHLAPAVAAAPAAEQLEAVDAALTIPFDLPAPARVTLAIDDAHGRRVRNLLAARPYPAGTNQVAWDGLDDAGHALPPGDYRYTALHHAGIHTRYAMSFANPGDPTWDTPDGRGAFYADHTNPQAVAAGGDGVALACPMGEAGQHLIGCDLDGHRRWGLGNRGSGDLHHIALATDGTVLWVASDGATATVYRVELATGRYAPWTATARDAQGRDYRVLDLPVSQAPRGPLGNLTALAVHGGRLAIALTGEHAVKLLDGASGAVQATIPLDAPRALAFAGDDLL